MSQGAPPPPGAGSKFRHLHPRFRGPNPETAEKLTEKRSASQYRKSYLFHAPTNYDNNYVNITAVAGVPVTLDGAAVPGFVTIGNSGFAVARAALSNAGSGNHTISSAQPFGISVYGYGQYTSYWYPGGTELTKLHN